MSKHFNVHPNIRNIGQLSNEEIEKEYGVTINEDGSVDDTIFDQKFETVGEWTAFLIEQEEMEYEERFDYNDKVYY